MLITEYTNNMDAAIFNLHAPLESIILKSN